MYIGILIKRLGYQTYLAECGEEAIKLALKKRPSVIVLDHIMPKMDGLSCLEIIRSHTELNDTPVLILTAYGDKLTRDKFQELGCCGFLKKPVNISEFYSTIRGCLKYDNKRRDIRVLLSLKVSIKCPNETRELHASNLSTGGMFLRTVAPFDIGTEMDIVFNIDNEAPIKLKSKVVYSSRLTTEIEPEPGMGIKFLNIPGNVRHRISSFVMKEIANDLTLEAENINI